MQDNANRLSRLIIASFILVLIATNLVNYFTFGYQPGSGAGTDQTKDLERQQGTVSLPAALEPLGEVLEIMTTKYLDPLEVTDLVRGAIKGMLDALEDPQTGYLDPQELENLLLQTSGSFGGIGVRIIDVEEDVVVLETFPESPAAEAGIIPGDRIRFAAGIDLTGQGVSRAAELMRGEKGTEVEVVVERPGADEPINITLERDEIQVKTVSSRLIAPGTGYIRISNFDSYTGTDFEAQLQQLEGQGQLQGLILDLRSNTGGLVNEAIKVARHLVPEGEITSLVERDGKISDVHKSYTPGKPYPIVVLVNSETASAAEIVAGALRDRTGAGLVGEKTFGKATVQTLEMLSEGGGLKLTIAKYLTPSGIDLQDEGLEPDYYVEQPEALRYHRYFLPGQIDEGDYGFQVQLLQGMLEELGYSLKQNGLYDAVTVEAIKSFQANTGIPVSGVFDDLTWIHFREALEIRSRENDPQLQKSIEILNSQRS